MRSYKLHGSGASKEWSRRGGAGGGTEPTDVAGGQSHPGLGQPWSTRCWTSTNCFDIYIWIPRRCGILTTTRTGPCSAGPDPARHVTATSAARTDWRGCNTATHTWQRLQFFLPIVIYDCVMPIKHSRVESAVLRFAAW